MKRQVRKGEAGGVPSVWGMGKDKHEGTRKMEETLLLEEQEGLSQKDENAAGQTRRGVN